MRKLSARKFNFLDNRLALQQFGAGREATKRWFEFKTKKRIKRAVTHYGIMKQQSQTDAITAPTFDTRSYGSWRAVRYWCLTLCWFI